MTLNGLVKARLKSVSNTYGLNGLIDLVELREQGYDAVLFDDEIDHRI